MTLKTKYHVWNELCLTSVSPDIVMTLKTGTCDCIWYEEVNLNAGYCCSKFEKTLLKAWPRKRFWPQMAEWLNKKESVFHAQLHCG